MFLLDQNAGMLRLVYPEPNAEILRFAQDDSEWAQHDSVRLACVTYFRNAAQIRPAHYSHPRRFATPGEYEDRRPHKEGRDRPSLANFRGRLFSR